MGITASLCQCRRIYFVERVHESVLFATEYWEWWQIHYSHVPEYGNEQSGQIDFFLVSDCKWRLLHIVAANIIFHRLMGWRWFALAAHSTKAILCYISHRDRQEYRYRIEKADTKALGISIGLDRGYFWVSVSVPVSIQGLVHFLYGFGRILIK